MPASKKDVRNQKQRQNKKLGIGDKDGKIGVVKAAQVKGKCTICLQEIVASKGNHQAKMHAESKHNKKLTECFPDFEE